MAIVTDRKILGCPPATRPEKKKRFMSEQEATEKGFRLWPKWAPVAQFALVVFGLLAQGVYSHATRDAAVNQLTTDLTTMTASLRTLSDKVDLDYHNVNLRIDAVNTDRATRHEEYEKNLIETRATDAQLLEITREHGSQLDRIETDLDKRSK